MIGNVMGRAVIFHGPNCPLEIARFPRPTAVGAEILVRVACCTLCKSDLHTHAGRRTQPLPTVLGHEIVGRIEAFGPRAQRRDFRGVALAIGARISWTLTASCGTCFFCKEALPQKCETLFKYGHERMGPEQPFVGGLADWVVLREGTACFHVPDAVPDEVAACANCATATVAGMLRAAGGVADRNVLILGAGVLGLTASAMACAAGASAVLVCDPDPVCRERARAFGATAAYSPDELAAGIAAATGGRGVGVVLELAGVASAVEAGLTLARIGGTILLAGTVLPTPAVPLDPEQLVRRMLTIRGMHNYAPQDLAAALDFLAGPGRAFPFETLVGQTFSLDKIEQAFEHAHGTPGFRVAVRP
ncbi:MAG: alcohol dehydrogenase catalytic domain-containing protein [Planctomycetes bacterium]|nr:alcohol dehydrogenase catalytic domain-containing protein [Planctomycetota bacterium]